LKKSGPKFEKIGAQIVGVRAAVKQFSVLVVEREGRRSGLAGNVENPLKRSLI